MIQHNTLLRAAVTGVLSLVAGGFTVSAVAATEDHSNQEKCAGIVKAAKNDCATSMNSCHGHAAADRTAEAWIYLPKGTCDRIAGAHLTAAIDPTPGVKN